MADSITARKRMGQHITDNHPKDILFEKGKEPNDFETESVAK